MLWAALAKDNGLTCKVIKGPRGPRWKVNYIGGREGTAFYTDHEDQVPHIINRMKQFKERRL